MCCFLGVKLNRWRTRHKRYYVTFVNAAGDAFPGVFVCPWKKVNLEKMVDLPEGFLPLAHQSGWMNEDLFFYFSSTFEETSRVFTRRSNSIKHGQSHKPYLV